MPLFAPFKLCRIADISLFPPPSTLPDKKASPDLTREIITKYLSLFNLATQSFLDLSDLSQAQQHTIIGIEKDASTHDSCTYNLVGYICYPETSDVWVQLASEGDAQKFLQRTFQIAASPASQESLTIKTFNCLKPFWLSKLGKDIESIAKNALGTQEPLTAHLSNSIHKYIYTAANIALASKSRTVASILLLHTHHHINPIFSIPPNCWQLLNKSSPEFIELYFRLLCSLNTPATTLATANDTPTTGTKRSCPYEPSNVDNNKKPTTLSETLDAPAKGISTITSPCNLSSSSASSQQTASVNTADTMVSSDFLYQILLSTNEGNEYLLSQLQAATSIARASIFLLNLPSEINLHSICLSSILGNKTSLESSSSAASTSTSTSTSTTVIHSINANCSNLLGYSALVSSKMLLAMQQMLRDLKLDHIIGFISTHLPHLLLPKPTTTVLPSPPSTLEGRRMCLLPAHTAEGSPILVELSQEQTRDSIISQIDSTLHKVAALTNAQSTLKHTYLPSLIRIQRGSPPNQFDFLLTILKCNILKLNELNELCIDAPAISATSMFRFSLSIFIDTPKVISENSVADMYCALSKDLKVHYCNSHIYYLGIIAALWLYKTPGHTPYTFHELIQTYQAAHPTFFTLNETVVANSKIKGAASARASNHDKVLFSSAFKHATSSTKFSRFSRNLAALLTRNTLFPQEKLIFPLTPTLLHVYLNFIYSKIQARSFSDITFDAIGFNQASVSRRHAEFTLKRIPAPLSVQGTIHPVQDIIPDVLFSRHIKFSDYNFTQVSHAFFLNHTIQSELAKLQTHLQKHVVSDTSQESIYNNAFPCILEKITSSSESMPVPSGHYLMLVIIPNIQQLLQVLEDSHSYGVIDADVLLQKLVFFILEDFHLPTTSTTKNFSRIFNQLPTEQQNAFIDALTYLTGFMIFMQIYDHSFCSSYFSPQALQNAIKLYQQHPVCLQSSYSLKGTDLTERFKQSPLGLAIFPFLELFMDPPHNLFPSTMINNKEARNKILLAIQSSQKTIHSLCTSNFSLFFKGFQAVNCEPSNADKKAKDSSHATSSVLSDRMFKVTNPNH